MKIYYVRYFDNCSPMLWEFLLAPTETLAIARWIGLHGYFADKCIEALDVTDSPYAQQRAI